MNDIERKTRKNERPVSFHPEKTALMIVSCVCVLIILSSFQEAPAATDCWAVFGQVASGTVQTGVLDPQNPDAALLNTGPVQLSTYESYSVSVVEKCIAAEQGITRETITTLDSIATMIGNFNISLESLTFISYALRLAVIKLFSRLWIRDSCPSDWNRLPNAYSIWLDHFSNNASEKSKAKKKISEPGLPEPENEEISPINWKLSIFKASCILKEQVPSGKGYCLVPDTNLFKDNSMSNVGHHLSSSKRY
ncbi:MAG: hypothetical protein LBT40_02945 [Deltaproteobacteria bacterium]|jgi:hypothetical protein|nr:hypothetical protein [Deltaproteobacteria bacterium]